MNVLSYASKRAFCLLNRKGKIKFLLFFGTYNFKMKHALNMNMLYYSILTTITTEKKSNALHTYYYVDDFQYIYSILSYIHLLCYHNSSSQH